MIDWNAEHINFVIAAYAIAALVLAIVIIQPLLQARALKRQLQAMNLADTGRDNTPT
jgi:heme exporter protein CcmD